MTTNRLIGDLDGGVHIQLNSRSSDFQPSQKTIEEQISEVLELPVATTATMLTILHLEIAPDMILDFVQSRTWKSISLKFPWWARLLRGADPDPSLYDLLKAATRHTLSLALNAYDSRLEFAPHIQAVASVLQEEGTNTEKLVFENCHFDCEEAVALASAFGSSQTLCKLDSSFCEFEQDSLQQLAASLTCRLEEIWLSLETRTNMTVCRLLFRAFHRTAVPSSSPSIVIVPMMMCGKTHLLLWVFFFPEMIVTWKSSIGAPDCKTDSFEHFAQGLGTNHSLRELTLVEIPISDDLAESLVDAFRQHSALQEVEIRDAKLTDEGVLCIGKAILAMPHLKVARISHRSCTAETAEFLVKSMKKHYSLEHFCFVHDKASPELHCRQA